MLNLRRVALLVATMLIAAACSSAGTAPDASPSSAAGGAGAAGPSAAAAVTIGTAKSTDFGNVLTGPTGMTLYTYAKDTATSSTCTGACAREWPPLVATGQAMAGAGVTGALGTLTRPDGTTQITYAGRPLYYWQGDTKAGDVTGNGIDDFSVATVSGAAPKPAASAAAAPAAPASNSYRY